MNKLVPLNVTIHRIQLIKYFARKPKPALLEMEQAFLKTNSFRLWMCPL